VCMAISNPCSRIHALPVSSRKDKRMFSSSGAGHLVFRTDRSTNAVSETVCQATSRTQTQTQTPTPVCQSTVVLPRILSYAFARVVGRPYKGQRMIGQRQQLRAILPMQLRMQGQRNCMILIYSSPDVLTRADCSRVPSGVEKHPCTCLPLMSPHSCICNFRIGP